MQSSLNEYLRFWHIFGSMHIWNGALAKYGIVEIKCASSLRNYSLSHLIFVGSKLALD
jgi:hypothetical protein